MAEYYVKKNSVEYELSNGKILKDTYEKEKDKVLESRLNQMEETINFKYKPYDFSFVNLSGVSSKKNTKKMDKEINIENEIVSFLQKYSKKIQKGEQLVLGINKASVYKDKWFIYSDNGKNNKTIDEINFRPYCARIDYIPSKNKAYLQYILEDKGKVFKEEFDVKIEEPTDDDVLKEYLK